MKLNEMTLYVWINQPVKVELGSYIVLAKYVKKINFICLEDFPKERKDIGWGNEIIPNTGTFFVNNNLNDYVQKMLTDETAVNIVGGLSGKMAERVCPILKANKVKYLVVSERPRISFSSPKYYMRSILLILKNFLLKLKYNKNVYCILALGELGVKAFRLCGWSSKKIVHFMYCGDYVANTEYKPKNPEEKIKFLYVGRFGYNHAVDIMMKAFDCIDGLDYQFDLAGGYGENKDEVFNWIGNRSNTNFIGKLDYSDVCNKMKEYDVLVVPSRLEGWNCQICEALSICMPVVTFDESVSSELVRYGKFGLTINGQSHKKFAESLKYTIDNPDMINVWKNNAKEYFPVTSSEVVGKYYAEIISAVVNNEKKPSCPWKA